MQVRFSNTTYLEAGNHWTPRVAEFFAATAWNGRARLRLCNTKENASGGHACCILLRKCLPSYWQDPHQILLLVTICCSLYLPAQLSLWKFIGNQQLNTFLVLQNLEVNFTAVLANAYRYSTAQ